MWQFRGSAPRHGVRPGSRVRLSAAMEAARTIAVVDDEPHIRETVAFALRREGYDVVEHPDGLTAWNAFDRKLPDLVVLDCRFHIRGLLGGNELGLEQRNVLGVVELDDVERLVDVLRDQRGHDQHVRIPLDHDVRIVGQPDRAVRRQLAVVILEYGLVPALVGLGAGLGERGHADALHRVPVGKLPGQVVAGDEVAQARSRPRSGQLTRLVEQRRGLPQYRERKIVVDAHITAQGARFVIRDEGHGFDLPHAALAEGECFEKGRQRGLMLMQSLMDEVSYNDAGNEVTMIKRARAG